MRTALCCGVAVILAVAAAAAKAEDGGPMPGDLGNPTIGAPLGANDPPDFQPTPPPLVAHLPPAAVEQLRAQLIGKPVFGSRGGRVGEVSSLGVGLDGSVGAVTVAIDGPGPDKAHLAVPWALVRAQVRNPTLVLPWDAESVRWLTAQR